MSGTAGWGRGDRLRDVSPSCGDVLGSASEFVNPQWDVFGIFSLVKAGGGKSKKEKAFLGMGVETAAT